jgi:parallel beta-helix repeat protein
MNPAMYRLPSSTARLARLVVALLASVALGTAAAAAHAAVINVPADQPTIQDAVDAAAPGDTISVAAGEYHESVHVGDDNDGITIESADPDDPFTIRGTRGVSDDGVRIDHANGVTLRNFAIRGAYDGVRLLNSQNSVLSGLTLEDDALHIRVSRGANNAIIQCTLLGAVGDRGVEQALLIDHSPGTIVSDTVVDGAKREGIRVLSSPCVRLLNDHVTNSRGADGIRVLTSPGTSIQGCTSSGNEPNGVYVTNSAGLVLVNNAATDNPGIGIRVEKSAPFAADADVMANGNVATGNGQRDVKVRPDPSNRAAAPCPGTSPIPTPRPTRTEPAPEPTPQATAVVAAWRLYLRIALTGGDALSVDVPKRSIDVPIGAFVRPELLPSFKDGVRVTGAKLATLGDTLESLSEAADAHMRLNPGDYPGYAGVTSIFWAIRVDTDGPVPTAELPTPTPVRTITPTATPRPTATAVGPTPSVLTTTQWQVYVRILTGAGNENAVDVPQRSTDLPVVATIRTADLPNFLPGVHVGGQELGVIGNTLQILTTATDGYIRGHADDFPDFASIVEIIWAARIDGAVPPPPTPTATVTPIPVPTPRAFEQWQLYVRILTTAGNPISVNVPLGSIDVPVVAAILASQLPLFPINVHVTTAQIAGLGGDTLDVLRAAADVYMRGHPADYPDFDTLVDLVWAARLGDAGPIVPTPTATATPGPNGPPTTLTQWEFYVRIATTAGNATSVDVPQRATDKLVLASIPTDQVPEFVSGVHVTNAQIGALGGDTLQILTDAADAYMRGHFADYPTFDSVIAVVWAARIDGTIQIPTPTRTATPTVTPTPIIGATPHGTLTAAEWRTYVRINTTVGSVARVNVPAQSADQPLEIPIGSKDLSTFPLGVRKTESVINGLGDDTLDRLVAASSAYIAAHPGDYPQFDSVAGLEWAIRVGP